jgi:hypothetical protein
MEAKFGRVVRDKDGKPKSTHQLDPRAGTAPSDADVKAAQGYKRGVGKAFKAQQAAPAEKPKPAEKPAPATDPANKK